MGRSPWHEASQKDRQVVSGCKKNIFTDIYKRLYSFYGPQGWWPGDTRLEIIVGAILTQATSWKNVEKAIRNLKKAKALSSLSKIKSMRPDRLSRLIRPAGYHNIKSKRLRNLLDFLSSEYGADLDKLARRDIGRLRQEFLSVNGIGEETADSILLYAFRKPVFVVDAYTKRIFSRHNIVKIGAKYSEIQKVFTRNLFPDEKLYNEYHALIVRLGKEYCRKTPSCARCPLKGM